MKVAVAGGTGMVGRHVVEELRRTGHEPVVLSRSRGVDLTSGAGLEQALAGCEAAVDVSNVNTIRRKPAVAFFTAVTGNLQRTGQQAGVRHLVALSIVGIDRVGLGYYKGKLRQEELVAAGPLPWSVLRATQFHEFAQQFLERTPGPVLPVPRMLSQPVAAREVGAALAALAVGAPTRTVTSIAGPEPLQMIDMVRQVVRARKERRLIVPLRAPGSAATAAANGGLLPNGPYTKGQQTFAEYLQSV